MDWVRANGTTLVGWVVVVSMALGSQLTSLDASEQALAETVGDVASNARRVTQLESDVRLLDQTVKRQEQIVTRQERAQQDLDRLVVELKTMVEVHRGN